ncbi:MAG: hypothetical protein J6Y82_00500 [Bacteroidales bacterium]|nr:hypothetical protein [Bacteroidales bacterium]
MKTTVTIDLDTRNADAMSFLNYMKTLSFVTVRENDAIIEDMKRSRVEAENLMNDKNAKGCTADEIISMI